MCGLLFGVSSSLCLILNLFPFYPFFIILHSLHRHPILHIILITRFLLYQFFLCYFLILVGIEVNIEEIVLIVQGGEFNIYLLLGHVHIYAEHRLCTVIFSLFLFCFVIIILILFLLILLISICCFKSIKAILYLLTFRGL